MAFFDYDMLVNRNGAETYVLRANTQAMQPAGSYCRVYRDRNRWCRKTKWHGQDGSVRYYWFDTLDEALTSGIRWASRRYRQEKQHHVNVINQVCKEGGAP